MKTALLTKTSTLIVLFVALLTNTVSAFTAVSSGNWSSAATWGGIAPGSNVAAQDITIPSGITVNMDVDVTFTGVLNSFTVNGSLVSEAGRTLLISQGNFTGSGVANLDVLRFDLLGTYGFTGVLSAGSLQNGGATLLLASVIELADSLVLEAGNVVLNAGANLMLDEGSTIVVDAGTININGGIFNTDNSYNLIYTGSSKVTGPEFNSTSVDNLFIRLQDNNQMLTMNGAGTVNGDLFLEAGSLNISGVTFTINGNLDQGNGALLTANQLTNLVLGGNSTEELEMLFTSGSSLASLTVNRTSEAVANIASDLTVTTLNLIDGVLQINNSSTLTLGANSLVHIEDGRLQFTGGSDLAATSPYNVEYTGASNITGEELTGAGLTQVTIDLNSSADEITLSDDATLTGTLALTSGRLNLNGNDLTLNGFTAGTNGSFVGNAASTLQLNLTSSLSSDLSFASGGQVLRGLVLNLQDAGTLALASALSIVEELNLTSGRLDIGDFNLTIQSTGNITGFNQDNFIVTSGQGVLQMRVTPASPITVFPIGTESGFSPAGIQQAAGAAAGNFMVRAVEGVLAQGNAGTNLALSRSVVNRTWMITSDITSNLNMDLRLNWEESAEVNGFDRTKAFISHNMNGAWDTFTEGTATTGMHGTFQIERSGITSLSPFTVMDAATLLNVNDVDAVVVNVLPNPATDVLNIILNDQADHRFEIISLTGQVINASTITKGGHHVDVTSLVNGAYFLKIYDVNGNTVVKKFIKS